jgi:heme/copper-type cytochrome/quinol oxidase subunit 2
MAAAIAFLPLAVETAAEEGKKIITGMLIVGIIFVSVIALGQTSRWLRHRRKVRKAAQRLQY